MKVALLVLCGLAGAMALGGEEGVTSLDEEGVVAHSGMAADVEAKVGQGLRYRDVLQHIADKYCTYYKHKVGDGAIFCQEMVGLQEKWAQAEELGETHHYMKMLGAINGHMCATKLQKEWDHCKVFNLMIKAVPVRMKWSPERKKFLQLNKDIAKHYCKQHGEADIFCPLTRALAPHYFDAVNDKKAVKYTAYIKGLQKHYCAKKGAAKHPFDERCSIFPLLHKGLPADFVDDGCDGMCGGEAKKLGKKAKKKLKKLKKGVKKAMKKAAKKHA